MLTFAPTTPFIIVGLAGIEPATFRLKGGSSTNELQTKFRREIFLL
jgi:hypothetical protein